MDLSSLLYGLLFAIGLMAIAWFSFVLPAERRQLERKLALVQKRIAEREARKSETIIRDEGESDADSLRALHIAAFTGDAEARLVDRLRDSSMPSVSLVAEANDTITGHILFTPVRIEPDTDATVMSLAPMAVTPGRQRQGTGSRLVEAGLERCRRQGAGAVVVLGHADYYPKFGFVPASAFDLKSTWDVPDEVFMALELVPGALRGVSGTVHYPAAFDDL